MPIKKYTFIQSTKESGMYNEEIGIENPIETRRGLGYIMP